MSQAELIAAVAAKAGVSQEAATKVYKALKEQIHEQLAAGEEARLNGLGKFRRVSTAPRKARNPRTGEQMTVPAGTKVKFYAAKELKDAVQ